MASGDLWLITTQTPVIGNSSERHNQTNGYTAVGESMPPGPKPGYYVGVPWLYVTYGPGSAHRHAYRGNKWSPLNHHF